MDRLTQRNDLHIPFIKGIDLGHLHQNLTVNELTILKNAVERLCSYEELYKDEPVTYKITGGYFGISDKDLFAVGKRSGNKKRSFLFISKLLGKHLAVNPEIVKASGYALASIKYGFDSREYVDVIKGNLELCSYSQFAEDNQLVIGFCETATALGMAVSNAIKQSVYITTTREPIIGIPKILSFEEEHSHATGHSIYSNIVNFSDFKKVTLVDDEISTGKTLLNLIEEIEKISPMDEYNVMTILDWRNQECRKAYDDFCKNHDVKINVYSIMQGEILSESNTTYENENVPVIMKIAERNNLSVFYKNKVETEYGKTEYSVFSEKFGISGGSIDAVEEMAYQAGCIISNDMDNEYNKKLLVLGHGENIYVPSRIATVLFRMGYDVQFRTTTLSPVYCDGIYIKDVVSFMDRDNKYYFYNQKEAEENYDSVIMIGENGIMPMLCNNMKYYVM